MTELIDSYQRRITYLRISVTDRCNLRCRYCMPEEGVDSLSHQHILSYEEIGRVVDAAVSLGVRKVRITGGEPLVRKGLVSFLSSLHERHPGLEIALTTNGLLLEQQAEALWNAGVRRLNISLDTLNPERFAEITRFGGLDRVLAGIARAEEFGFSPIKLNMVPILGINDDEIVDFVRLTIDRSLDVRFIEFMPVTGVAGYGRDRFFPAASIMERVRSVGEVEPVSSGCGDGPARMHRIAGAKGRVGIIKAVSDHFCGSCNRLRLTADGRLKPCLLKAEEIDVRELLRNQGDLKAVQQALIAAVTAKPVGHELDRDADDGNRRSMNAIGG